MKNYFIIHGSFNNSKGNWFHWLEKELSKKGKQVYNFDYPYKELQNFKNWSEVLNANKEKINEETTFFCHSVACVFIAKWCIENKVKIKKAVMVAPFNAALGNTEYDNANKTFLVKNLKDFITYCKERICIYTKDDPYIGFTEPDNFAEIIKAEKVIYEKGGHLNLESGYKEFKALLKYI